MAGNHLESLVAERYELRGYWQPPSECAGWQATQRRLRVLSLTLSEFHPEQRLLVQIEPSLDADGWAKREIGTRRNLRRAASTSGCFQAWRFPSTCDQIRCSFPKAESREHVLLGVGWSLFAASWRKSGRVSHPEGRPRAQFQRGSRSFADAAIRSGVLGKARNWLGTVDIVSASRNVSTRSDQAHVRQARSRFGVARVSGPVTG